MKQLALVTYTGTQNFKNSHLPSENNTGRAFFPTSTLPVSLPVKLGGKGPRVSSRFFEGAIMT